MKEIPQRAVMKTKQIMQVSIVELAFCHDFSCNLPSVLMRLFRNWEVAYAKG